MKSLVHRSEPELMNGISSKYGRNRTDYIEHATELADFVDELRNEKKLSRNSGKSHRDGSQVNAIASRRETRTCGYCKKKGHIANNCRSKKKATKITTLPLLAWVATRISKRKDDYQKVEDSWPTTIEWILDSGCGRHLTGSANLFVENTNAAGTSLILPDGARAKSMHKEILKWSHQSDKKRVTSMLKMLNMCRDSRETCFLMST